MPKGKHNNHAKADSQHRWQDLPQIASTGYVKLRVGKGHPLADPNGYAYAHLLIWGCCWTIKTPSRRGSAF